jgi:hypothetical protein
VLRDQGIDGRHPGDVDDRDLRARCDNLLQQALHDGLRPGAVERPDQRQGEGALRSGQIKEAELADQSRRFLSELGKGAGAGRLKESPLAIPERSRSE